MTLISRTPHQAHHLSPVWVLSWYIFVTPAPLLSSPLLLPDRVGMLLFCSLLPSLEERRLWALLRQSRGCLFGFRGYCAACASNHIFLVPARPRAEERKSGMTEVKHHPGTQPGPPAMAPLCHLGPCRCGYLTRKGGTRPSDAATSSFSASPRAPITPSCASWGHRHALNCRRNYRNENVCAGRSQAGCVSAGGEQGSLPAWVRLYL